MFPKCLHVQLYRFLFIVFSVQVYFDVDNLGAFNILATDILFILNRMHAFFYNWRLKPEIVIRLFLFLGAI